MKRAHALALVLLAGTLASVLWLVLRPRESELTSRDADERAVHTATESLDLVAQESARARAPANPGAVEHAAAPTPATERDAVPDGFTLRVLRYDNGEPVAGASVFVLALATPEAEAGLYVAPIRTIAKAKESGVRYESGADGRVQLPLADRRSLVFVEAGTLAGFAHLASSPELPTDLYVYEDAALRVRVVDEQGGAQPGFEVALVCAGSNRFSNEIATSATGDDGTVSIANVGLLHAKLASAALFARLRMPSDPPVEIPVDASAIARGEVVLEVPVSGEIEFLVQRVDGTPWPDPVNLAVHVDRLDRGPYASVPNEWTSYTAVQSRLLLSHVALGLHVHARAQRLGFGSIHARALGPTRAGERTTFVLTIPESPETTVIAGRLLDELGAPVERARVVAAYGNPFITRGISVLKLDPRGAFQWRPSFAARASGDLRLFFFTVTKDDAALDRCVTSELTAPLPPGTIQLGELIVRAPPPLCGGRVVTADGRGIAGAELALVTQGAVVGISPQVLRTRSDVDGRFTIRGLLESPQIFVVGRAEGFGETTIEFERERTDLTLVLQAAARIRGSIAPSERFRMDEILLRCDPTERKTSRTSASRTNPAHGSGAFAFTGLASGVFRVQVLVPPMVGAPLLLAEVGVRAGENVTLPQLEQVELDSRLHVFELRMRDSTGADVPVFDVTAWPAARDRSESELLEEGRHGRIRMTSTSASIEVVLSAAGKRSVRLTCSAGTHSVVLPPAFAIELVCEDFGARVPSGFALVPSLVTREPDASMENEDGVAFDARGVCRLPLANLGVHEVWFALRRSETFHTQHLELETPLTIEVRDTPALQTFEVAVPQEALERALAALRK